MTADENPFEPLFHSTISKMDFEDWLTTGIAAGYCSEPVCDTHDGLPMSDEEQAQFEDGYDPCIPAVRLLNEAAG